MCASGTTEEGAPISAYKAGNLAYKSGFSQKPGVKLKNKAYNRVASFIFSNH